MRYGAGLVWLLKRCIKDGCGRPRSSQANSWVRGRIPGAAGML